jgi:hypothetical protein
VAGDDPGVLVNAAYVLAYFGVLLGSAVRACLIRSHFFRRLRKAGMP